MQLIDPNCNAESYITVWDCNCSEYGRQKVMAVEDLHYLPTIEAEPIRHAHWIKSHAVKTNDTEIHYYAHTCSACNWRTGQQGEKFNYCPKCGAKMDKKK